LRFLIIIATIGLVFGNKKNMIDTLFLYQGKDRYLLKENFIYPESIEILS